LESTSLLANLTVDRAEAQLLLLLALRGLGPDTVASLVARYCPDFPGVLNKRASELVKAGEAEWTRETRTNATGRKARVLRITDKGRARLEGAGR
jgi:hypothetical protein